jgi:HD-GYP domain-containing protein (c-di-GMP phosphodiesterase class II)
MNSKQIVLTGLVFTSLLTSLVLVDFLPVVVLAILFLVTGMLATAFIGLNHRRREQLDKAGSIIEASKALHLAESIADITAQLCIRLKITLNCESVFLWTKEAGAFAAEGLACWPGWDEMSEVIIEKGKPLIVNAGDKAVIPPDLPDNIKSFMGVALDTGKSDVLYLINSSKGNFEQHDLKLAQAIALQASRLIVRFQSLEEEKIFYHSLLESAIRANEASLPRFSGHAERVMAISILLGRELGLEEEEMQVLKYSALMHDIGQTAVQGEMLKEKSADTGEELRISAEDHPSLGADMLPDSGIFQDIRKGIKYHHERYDGSGYPDGLERTEIPFIARIIAVADVFDAMTMLCAEEEKLQCRQAIREIRKGSGSFFDPLVVVALTDLEEEIVMLFQDSSLDRKLEATAEGS